MGTRDERGYDRDFSYNYNSRYDQDPPQRFSASTYRPAYDYPRRPPYPRDSPPYTRRSSTNEYANRHTDHSSDRRVYRHKSWQAPGYPNSAGASGSDIGLGPVGVRAANNQANAQNGYNPELSSAVDSEGDVEMRGSPRRMRAMSFSGATAQSHRQVAAIDTNVNGHRKASDGSISALTPGRAEQMPFSMPRKDSPTRDPRLQKLMQNTSKTATRSPQRPLSPPTPADSETPTNDAMDFVRALLLYAGKTSLLVSKHELSQAKVVKREHEVERWRTADENIPEALIERMEKDVEFLKSTASRHAADREKALEPDHPEMKRLAAVLTSFTGMTSVPRIEQDEQRRAAEEQSTNISKLENAVAEQGRQLAEQGRLIAEQKRLMTEQGQQIAKQALHITEEDRRLTGYNRRLSSIDQEISRNGQVLSDHGTELSRQSQQALEQKNKSADLQSKVDETFAKATKALAEAPDEKIDNHHREIVSLTWRITELENGFKDSKQKDDEDRDLQQAGMKIQDDVDVLKKQLNETNNIFKKAAEYHGKNAGELHKKVGSLDDLCAGLKKSMQNLEVKVEHPASGLKDRVEAFDNRLEEQIGDIQNQLKQQREGLDRLVNEHESQVEEQKGLLPAEQGRLAGVNPLQMNALQEKLQAVETYTMNHEQRINNMTMQPFLASIVHQFQQMYPAPAELTRRLHQVEQNLGVYQNSIINLQRKVAESDTALNGLQSALKTRKSIEGPSNTPNAIDTAALGRIASPTVSGRSSPIAVPGGYTPPHSKSSTDSILGRLNHLSAEIEALQHQYGKMTEELEPLRNQVNTFNTRVTEMQDKMTVQEQMFIDKLTETMKNLSEIRPSALSASKEGSEEPALQQERERVLRDKELNGLPSVVNVIQQDVELLKSGIKKHDGTQLRVDDLTNIVKGLEDSLEKSENALKTTQDLLAQELTPLKKDIQILNHLVHPGRRDSQRPTPTVQTSASHAKSTASPTTPRTGSMDHRPSAGRSDSMSSARETDPNLGKSFMKKKRKRQLDSEEEDKSYEPHRRHR